MSVLVARSLLPADRGASPPAGDVASPGGARVEAPAEATSAPAPATEPAEREDPLHAPEALAAPDPQAVWRRDAARAVRAVTRRKLDRTLSAADEQRLVDAMASVRWAASEGGRELVDPDDPLSVARERERTETILAADATFRDVTGVGVAEFLTLLDPGQIEDLAPRPTPGP